MNKQLNENDNHDILLQKKHKQINYRIYPRQQLFLSLDGTEKKTIFNSYLESQALTSTAKFLKGTQTENWRREKELQENYVWSMLP